MNPNEYKPGVREVIEESIATAGKSLLEASDALWIYDFNKALQIVNETLKHLRRRLRKVNLRDEELMSKARILKREKMLEGPMEALGHEITILAPIAMKLTKLRNRISYLLSAQERGILTPPKRIEKCVLIDAEELYLARCLLSNSLRLKGDVIETALRRALNPTDLEVYSLNTAVEAQVWLLNVVISIMIARKRLEIRMLLSPKMRMKLEEIEKIVRRIFISIDHANINQTL